MSAFKNAITTSYSCVPLSMQTIIQGKMKRISPKCSRSQRGWCIDAVNWKCVVLAHRVSENRIKLINYNWDTFRGPAYMWVGRKFYRNWFTVIWLNQNAHHSLNHCQRWHWQARWLRVKNERCGPGSDPLGEPDQRRVCSVTKQKRHARPAPSATELLCKSDVCTTCTA